MATDTFQASLPANDLYPGFQVVIEAISPTTGAAVSGVVITDVALQGDDANDTPDLPDPVPTFLPQPIHPGAN